MDINALVDLQLVATYGSFGRASRESGRAKATLSRRVADLEQQLGVRLFERGTQRLTLTTAGQLLLQRSEGPLREIEEAMTQASEGSTAPRGRLRIAAPLVFSQLALGRLSALFRMQYPQVELEVVAEDRMVDLVQEHFDLCIRINPDEDSHLVGRCFARDSLVLVAAPTLPMPRTRAGQTQTVPAVVMPNYRDGDVWSLRQGKLLIAPQPVLRMSSLMMVKDAVCAGAGAALLPWSVAGALVQAGQLKRWGDMGSEVELWVLHTSRRLQSPKVRAFVEFLCAQYPDGRFIT
ncbi:MAG TPA: LysR family transcriptional regulator [Herbaspirillum sp.]|uniref:LysR family transcriptional regulator n=1 Tax=Herbaspirillum sp. TaxID=1890675 RepID=UPI002D73B3AF|nr:LysR family transcriptional regulator [Herbaspirillum sp.]HZG19916.1 LysR family transcriptional regulator [Herbaspirillum sp.]